MLSAVKRTLDSFLGRGEAAVTVPILDGPLKPNQKLEEAPRLLQADGIDNLVHTADGIAYTSGRTLQTVGGTTREFSAEITCLAADGAVLAVGLDTGGVVISGGAHDGRTIGLKEVPCPTAVVFASPGTLIVASGAAAGKASDWRRDLMQLGQSGSVWKFEIASGKGEKLADGLAWPSGLATAPGGAVFVSESWRHRVLRLDPDRKAPVSVLSGLPAYPWRIAPAEGGGYWLTFYSVRNQLVDFILREHGYRRRMIAEVPEAYWMAPALASNLSFEEPLQGSRLKQMGQMKPWAATLSYGLVARCDAGMQPGFSYHSRADGIVHGIASVVEERGDLLVAAKGPGLLVRLEQAAARPVQGIQK